MPVRCNNADIAAYGLPFVSIRIAKTLMRIRHWKGIFTGSARSCAVFSGRKRTVYRRSCRHPVSMI